MQGIGLCVHIERGSEWLTKWCHDKGLCKGALKDGSGVAHKPWYLLVALVVAFSGMGFCNKELSEEIEIGDYVMQRKCPHRQADLSVFGEIEGNTLTCSLHGWRFDLTDGRCLNAENRPLRVRKRT